MEPERLAGSRGRHWVGSLPPGRRPSQCHEDELQLTGASGQVRPHDSQATIEKNFCPRYGGEPATPDLEQPPPDHFPS